MTTAARPTPAARAAAPRPTLRPASLAWRVVLLNSLVVLVATLALALGPATVSTPLHTREAVTLLIGVCVTLGANLVLVRRAFAPLVRLTRLMHKVDPLVPGRRLHVDAAPHELQELADAFNAMLERLEDERRESARRALRAQEDERRRVARELHDELGQTMTGVLLRIDEAIRAPESADLEEAREDARRSLDDVRRIARDLRPDTLAELGLDSALNALATRFTRQTRVPVDRASTHLPPLDERQGDRDLPRRAGGVDERRPPRRRERRRDDARGGRRRRDADRGRRRPRRPGTRGARRAGSRGCANGRCSCAGA